jgi:hypothetical protein
MQSKFLLPGIESSMCVTRARCWVSMIELRDEGEAERGGLDVVAETGQRRAAWVVVVRGGDQLTVSWLHCPSDRAFYTVRRRTISDLTPTVESSDLCVMYRTPTYAATNRVTSVVRYALKWICRQSWEKERRTTDHATSVTNDSCPWKKCCRSTISLVARTSKRLYGEGAVRLRDWEERSQLPDR